MSAPSNEKAPFVFLGGSCGTTTWRKAIAMPLLDLNGISYYNPQVADWSPSLMEKESAAKAAAKALVFVISRLTPSTATMIEAAYYIGRKRAGLFLQADAVLVAGQAKTRFARADVNRARAYLTDLVKLEEVSLPESIGQSDCVAEMMQAAHLIGARKKEATHKKIRFISL